MAIDKVAMECGGKRSATPLWLRVALLLDQRITAVRESGVALRLPPHSTSVAPGHLGDFVSRPVQGRRYSRGAVDRLRRSV
jgi:hypothetical protein